MDTYEIKYKSAQGSVQVARVCANSVYQAVFNFLEDYDLPVLSATRTDLLTKFKNKTMEINLYKVAYRDSTDRFHVQAVYEKSETEAREHFSRHFPNTKVLNVLFIRPATANEYDMLAGGAPSPKH